MKHIGILAHSAEGASLCFLNATHEGAKHMGEHLHPEITMSMVAMGEAMPLWEADGFAGVRKIFMHTAGRLAAAGADFFVLPDNTAHLALEVAGEAFPIPALHIADVVAEEAAARGFQTIGVLGTKWTMEGSVYRDALARRDLGRVIPEDDDRAFINESIFAELCNGVFTDATRARYVKIIDKLKAAGCDAVALVCTEIPILISPEDSSLATLDSTRLLGKAAVEVAVGKRPMPTWRGGPIS
jgi:aspartate racemase